MNFPPQHPLTHIPQNGLILRPVPEQQVTAVYPKLRQGEAERLHEFERNALSANSIKAYTHDLRAFTKFLADREPSLVTTPEKASYVHCLLFLTNMAERGLALATINRRWAFLRRHLVPALCDPQVEEKYRHVIAGMRRKLDKGLVRGKKPIMETDLYRIVGLITCSDIHSRQARVLLLFLFHGAMRRSEVQAARWRDLTFKTHSLVVRIPVSKTGTNQVITIPRRARDDPRPCVVHKLEKWKRAQHHVCETDFVFRKVSRTGELTSQPLQIHEMSRIVKDGVSLLGVDRLQASEGGVHSLRKGFCSSAADRNVPIAGIQARGRRRSLAGLQPYLHGTQVENHGI